MKREGDGEGEGRDTGIRGQEGEGGEEKGKRGRVVFVPA